MYSFSYKDLFNAYYDCLKNKKNTYNAIKFSLNIYENIIDLCDDINNGKYEIGKSTAFVITYPKYREIFAADFRDRIVHHLVIGELMPYFEDYFIKESFSCMKNRGTLYGVKIIEQYIRDCSQNYTNKAYILKMDVQSFFMTIDKNLLSNMLDEFIVKKYPDNKKKNCLRMLCRKIILHHPEENCERHSPIEMWSFLDKGKSLFDVDKGKGLAIGNLTSQVFANFYMTLIDYYIKEVLNIKYYGRYVDDLILIHNDKEYLKQCMSKIKIFLQDKLMLTINPNKIYLQPATHGVNFIGATIMTNRIYCGNRTISALINKLIKTYRKYEIKYSSKFMSSINSYLGLMKHYSTYNIRKRIFNNYISEEWKMHIKIFKNLNKINIIE